jgi:tetratricopeptide (TPR) repeat protein
VSRRYESAISSYERALKLKPRHAWLWERLGKAFEEKGDIIGAAEAYQRAIQKSPAVPLLWTDLAAVHSFSQQHDQAIKDLGSVVSQLPTSTLLWDALGTEYAASGEYAKALDVYDEALRKKPTGSWLRFGKGDVYGRMGDLGSPTVEYQHGLRFHDKSFLYGLVDSFLSHPHVPLEVDDGLVWAFPCKWICTVATAVEASRLYDTMITAYETILRKKKGNTELLFQYEYTIPDTFKRGHLSEVYVWVILGEACFAKGDFSRAIQAHQKAAEWRGTANEWLSTRSGEARQQLIRNGTATEMDHSECGAEVAGLTIPTTDAAVSKRPGRLDPIPQPPKGPPHDQ